MPSGWESAVCDQTLCFPAEDLTGELIMSIGESFDMKANLYPYNTKNCGSTVIKVVSDLDPNNADSFYTMICTFDPANVLAVEKEEISVYPNPTTDVITVKTTNTRIETVEIMDILGNRVLTGKTNSVIDVRSLKSGIYFARFNQETIRFTKR